MRTETQTTSLKLAVIVASTGRAPELAQLIEQLSRQTRLADRIVISVVSDADVPADLPDFVTVVMGSKGLCGQRNRGLDLVLDKSDIVVFFDDDYLPSRNSLEAISMLFANNADVVGLTGKLLADGIKTAGISYREAMEMIEEYDRTNTRDLAIRPISPGLYGCNMVYRSAAIGGVRFDENLPLYGWQEDIDFAASVSRRGGRLAQTNAFAGVHRGTKSGRTSGKKLGYSQIINPVYLYRKGTIDGRFASNLIIRNVLSNLHKAIYPESWIDRRGRLLGNLIGIVDLIRGKVDPTAMLQL
jgi:hypothetical protein